MRNFIEVTYQKDTKYTININRIVWFAATVDGKKTTLILSDCTRFTVDENYNEIKAKIEDAKGL